MIVFDLDGTLVDSRPEILGAMEHAWNSVVGDGAFPRGRYRVGPPLLDSIAGLSPALGADRIEAIAAAFRARYDASDFSSTLPYPGIAAALDALRGRGRTLALATNKRRAPTLAIVERWFPQRFAHVACVDGVWPDDGTRPGTKAAMLAWLVRVARAEAGSAVMVGDTAGDVAAARAVGMRAVAVAWGYEDVARLGAAGPDELVHDAAGLLRALAPAA